MNIALSTIIIFLLVLPGILFRYSYRRGTWRSPVFFDSFTNELLFGVAFSIVIHAIAALMVKMSGYEHDLRTVLALLSGFWTLDSFNSSAQVLKAQFSEIAWYIITTCASALILGRILHMVVRQLALDLKTTLFRFNNEWYYLLSGEQGLIDGIKAIGFWQRLIIPRKKIENIFESMYCFVSVVITHGGESYLYWGILSDFFFGKDGKLDRLILRKTSRRTLAKDSCEDEPHQHSPEDKRFYPIQGHSIVIDYAKINTMNVEYRYVIEDKESNDIEYGRKGRNASGSSPS